MEDYYEDLPSFSIALAVAIFYVVAIPFIVWIMKDRKPLTLKLPFLVHNVILTIYSSATFCLFIYCAVFHMTYRSLSEFICDPRGEFFQGLQFYVMKLFVFSKVYEMLDTFFLAFKKSRIQFLHYFHHFATVLLAWWVFPRHFSPVFIFGFMNAGVHGPMYYYYAMMTIGKRVWWRRYITVFQILQHLTALICILAYVINHKFFGSCGGGHYAKTSVYFAFFCYGVYLVLFVKLYIDNYVSRSKMSEDKKK